MLGGLKVPAMKTMLELLGTLNEHLLIKQIVKKQFTISGGYQWSSTDSKMAIQKVSNDVIKRFNGENEKTLKYNINYRRLRSSAGRSMLDSIISKIKNSQVVIFDITDKNPNVMLELGYALALSIDNDYLSIYLISKKGEPLPHNIPTDLHGYFISEYTIENGEVKFKDNGSLRMSIESDVKEYFNQIFTDFNPINETE